MTDHLAEAADRAVELAAELAKFADQRGAETVAAAAHLAYVAGLLRGSAERLDEPARSGRRAEFVAIARERNHALADRGQLLGAARNALSLARDLAPELNLDQLAGVVERMSRTPVAATLTPSAEEG